jgi:hypothetical protein
MLVVEKRLEGWWFVDVLMHCGRETFVVGTAINQWMCLHEVSVCLHLGLNRG